MEEKRNRDKRIYVRVTDSEYDKIVKKAKKAPSLNDYMVDMALRGKIIVPAPSIDREALIEMNRIGVNLNQLTNIINSSHANIFHSKTKAELEEMISGLKKLLGEQVGHIRKKVEK